MTEPLWVKQTMLDVEKLMLGETHLLGVIVNRLERNNADFGIFANGDVEAGRNFLAQTYKAGFVQAILGFRDLFASGKVTGFDIPAAFETLSSAGEDVRVLIYDGSSDHNTSEKILALIERHCIAFGNQDLAENFKALKSKSPLETLDAALVCLRPSASRPVVDTSALNPPLNAYRRPAIS